MSDLWGPTAGDEGAGQPPPPPPAPPLVEPDLTLETAGTVSRSAMRGGRVVAGVVGALLLIGGTTFAVTQLGSSGPDSPEEAVADLLDAASNEDVLGMLAALDPGERDTLRQPLQDLAGELERLEVLDPSFELDGVAGIDIEFAGVTYRTEPVRDDLARVYLTGGTVTGSFDAGELPIGDFVHDTLERFGGDLSGASGTDTSSIEDDDTFLVARRGSDGWRVSIGYTVAEAARLDAGLPLLDGPLHPVGAETPEAAVRDLIQAAAGFDLRGVVARLSPDELGVLQDYAALWLDDAAAAMAEAGAGWDVTVDDLSLRSDQSGDRASVYIDAFTLSVDGEGQHITVATDGECITIAGIDDPDFEESPFGDGPVCTDDLQDLSGGWFGYGSPDELGDADLPDLSALPPIETPSIGITTTKIDGGWYVAPVATALDGLVSGLEVLDREHLDAIVDYVEAFFNSFESFTEIGTEIDGSGGGLGEYPYDDDLTVPTTVLDGQFPAGAPPVDEAALEELVRAYAGPDTELAECMLDELFFASDLTRFELADSYRYDYAPSQEAQDVFFAADARCRTG